MTAGILITVTLKMLRRFEQQHQSGTTLCFGTHIGSNGQISKICPKTCDNFRFADNLLRRGDVTQLV